MINKRISKTLKTNWWIFYQLDLSDGYKKTWLEIKLYEISGIKFKACLLISIFGTLLYSILAKYDKYD